MLGLINSSISSTLPQNLQPKPHFAKPHLDLSLPSCTLVRQNMLNIPLCSILLGPFFFEIYLASKQQAANTSQLICGYYFVSKAQALSNSFMVFGYKFAISFSLLKALNNCAP